MEKPFTLGNDNGTQSKAIIYLIAKTVPVICGVVPDISSLQLLYNFSSSFNKDEEKMEIDVEWMNGAGVIKNFHNFVYFPDPYAAEAFIKTYHLCETNDKTGHPFWDAEVIAMELNATFTVK